MRFSALLTLIAYLFLQLAVKPVQAGTLLMPLPMSWLTPAILSDVGLVKLEPKNLVLKEGPTFKISNSQACQKMKVISSLADPDDQSVVQVKCDKTDGNRVSFTLYDRQRNSKEVLGDSKSGYTRAQLLSYRTQAEKKGEHTTFVIGISNAAVVAGMTLGLIVAVAGFVINLPDEAALAGAGANLVLPEVSLTVGEALATDAEAAIISDTQAEEIVLKSSFQKATPEEIKQVAQYLLTRPQFEGRTLGQTLQGFVQYLNRLPKGKIATFSDVEREVENYFDPPAVQSILSHLPPWTKIETLAGFLFTGSSAFGAFSRNILGISADDEKDGKEASIYLQDKFIDCSGCIQLQSHLISDFKTHLDNVLRKISSD